MNRPDQTVSESDVHSQSMSGHHNMANHFVSQDCRYTKKLQQVLLSAHISVNITICVDLCFQHTTTVDVTPIDFAPLL